MGSRAAALAMLALAVVPASAGAMPVVGGAAVAPQRIAIVVFENKDYDNSLDPTDRRFVVSNPAAPYINQTVIPESLSLVPTPLGCYHPPGDAAGVAADGELGQKGDPGMVYSDGLRAEIVNVHTSASSSGDGSPAKWAVTT